MADATKNCELFYFRFLSKVQKLLSSVKRWLIKAPTFQHINDSSLIVQTVNSSNTLKCLSIHV